MAYSFIFLVITCLMADAVFGYFQRHGFPDGILPLRRLHGLSWDECLKECERTGSCKSVLFRRQTQNCRLYDQLASPTGSPASDTGILYGEPAWRITKDTDLTCLPSLCSEAQTCGPDGTCIVAACGEPQQIPDSGIRGNMRQIGAKIKYTCLSNYATLEASEVSVCQVNGTWSDVALICDCGQPNMTSNVIGMGNATQYGANVSLDCEYGYRSTNSDVTEVLLTCQQNGEWAGVEFACEIDLTNMTDFGVTSTGAFCHASAIVVETYGSTRSVGVSRQECAEQCRLQTDYCIAISYRASNKTCQLVDRIRKVETLPGWDILHKYINISYSYGPNGRYTLSYQGAVDYCGSTGSSIATLQDVKSAYAIGYNARQCGWIEERIAVIALHFVIPGTYHSTGINTCNWSSTWGVFCKVKH